MTTHHGAPDALDRPHRVEGYALTATDSGGVVTDSSGRPVLELDAEAAAIWQLCDGATTVAEMADAADELFAADRAVLESDIRSALAAMVAAGVIRP